FRSLVLIGAIGMKPISASTSGEIVKRNLKIIVAKEPVESRPGFAPPAAITRYTVGLQTRRYGARSLKRLLIETRLVATLAIKTLRPDRYKAAIGFRALRFGEPVHRFEPRGDHAIIRTGRTDDQHGLRQSRVPVSQNVLKPLPIRTADRLIHVKQPTSEHRSDFLRVAVAGIRIEIFLNSEKRVGAGPRTVELHNCRQGQLE